MVRFTLVLSVICVSILIVYGDDLSNGRLIKLRCDYRSPDFEACQAKLYEEECAKRTNEKYRRCRECEPTCAVPNPQVCILSCTPGCVCQTGFLRDNTGRCIPAADCNRSI